MKKIIFVTRCFNPIFNTGASRSVSDIAFGLAELGWDVHLVVGKQGYQGYKDNKETEVIRGVCIHRIWNISFPCSSLLRRLLNYIIFYLSCSYNLIFLVKRNDIVVVTTDPPLISVVVDLIVRVKRAILINWLLDIYPEVAQRLGFRLIQGWRLKLFRSICNISWKKAVYNMVLGERMAQFVYSVGIENEKVRVFPNWEDGDLIKPTPVKEKNNFREQWGLQNKFVIGYFGNMGRAHEFETILDTAAHLRSCKETENIIFLFVGDGYYRRHIEKMIQLRELENVILKSYQAEEKLSESFAAANIHIISTRPNLEGLLVPLKLYGAMAAGRPIIFVGDHEGEIAKIARKYHCGSTVNVGKVQDLKETILSYYSCPEMCEQLGRNARVAFETYFNKSIAIKRWHGLLETIE